MINPLLNLLKKLFWKFSCFQNQKLREALPDEDDQEQGSEKTSDTEDAAKVEKLRRKRLAQEQRTKMMAKMNNMQQAFMNSHKGFFNKEEGMELDENV